MEDEIVKKHIDVIIENTFNTISEVYRTQMENQKIGTYNKGRVCQKQKNTFNINQNSQL